MFGTGAETRLVRRRIAHSYYSASGFDTVLVGLSLVEGSAAAA
jgi:hypothetical protein